MWSPQTFRGFNVTITLHAIVFFFLIINRKIVTRQTFLGTGRDIIFLIKEMQCHTSSLFIRELQKERQKY